MTGDQRIGFRGGSAVRQYFRSPARTVITAALMLTVIAAGGCGSGSSGGSQGGQSSSGGASGGQSSSGGASGGQSSSGGTGTTGSVTQWDQQYGGDVVALLNAASFDEGQIWSSGSCSATPTAVHVLEHAPPPPDSTIAMLLQTGETELLLAADSCSSVQQFIFGTRDVGNAAQDLGLSGG